MKKELFIVFFFGIVAFHLSGQNTLYPDSMVLKSLEGRGLNKQISVYDELGNEHTRVYYIQNERGGDWLKYMECFYEWDRGGNMTSETIFMQDVVLGEWIGLSRQLFVLDEHGNEVEKRSYAWNRQVEDWEANYKYRATFNEDGTKCEDYSFLSVGGQWQEFQNNKYEYKHDAKGNIMRMLQFEIDPADVGTYIEAKYRYEYKYNEQDKLMSSVNYMLLDGYRWMPRYLYEYEYDADGNQTLEVFFRGDTEYVDWEAHYQYGHSYGEDGKLASMFYYSWNAEVYDWTGNYNYQYHYDLNGNLDYIDLYAWRDNDWVLNETGHYYYPNQRSREMDGMRIVDSPSFVVFPNPASDFITVSGAEGSNMIVVNSEGRLVFSKRNIDEREVVQVASWQAGMYFVSVQREGSSAVTRKVLKR